MMCPYCLDEAGILIQTDDGTRCGDCGRLVPNEAPKDETPAVDVELAEEEPSPDTVAVEEPEQPVDE